MSGDAVKTALSDAGRSVEMIVDVRAVIEFFDVNTEAQQDASSIKAIIGEEIAFACMKRHFEADGTTKAGLVMTKKHPNRRLPCTTGETKGFQLDGWFSVENADGTTTCYQTEIKSWSFHGIGSQAGRMLIEEKETPESLDLKRKMFGHYYGGRPGLETFLQNGAKKVLLHMRQPAETKNHRYNTRDPKPLLCIWQAVCRPGASKSEIFFSVPVAPFDVMEKENGAVCKSGGFDTAYVFSVSNYLRAELSSAGSSRPATITLSLPRVSQRMQLLTAMFSPAIGG